VLVPQLVFPEGLGELEQEKQCEIVYFLFMFAHISVNHCNYFLFFWQYIKSGGVAEDFCTELCFKDFLQLVV